MVANMQRSRRITAEAALHRILESNESGTDEDIIQDDDSEPEGLLQPLTDEEDNSSSNDEDEVTRRDRNTDKLISKNGLVHWKKAPFPQTGRARASNIFRLHPGPSRQIRQSCSSADDIFDSFISPHMIRLIIQYTNAEGHRMNPNWIDTDEEEVRRFIGLLLLAGVYSSKNEAISQLWNLQDGRPIFGQAMSRNRFTELCARMRFDDAATRRERRTNDKLAPFREIWNCFVSKCKSNYVPGCDMTIDEQLVTFRGRCGFRMFIPSKPGRYGIKIWILADSSSSYCYNAEIYTGKIGNSREIGQATRVVLELTNPITNSGRNIIGDNFFSNLHLVQSLFARQLTYLGTIRKNKPELPPEVLPNSRRPVESSVFGFLPNCTIVSYVPKRNKAVTLISSNHPSAEICDNAQQKPSMIMDYNQRKSGVDTLDQVVRAYSCKRRTRRWPMCLFFNVLDIASYNSYVIFTNLHPGWNTSKSHRRRLFLIHLARLLINLESISGTPSLRDAGNQLRESHAREFLESRRRCKLCGNQKDRKTRMMCSKCHNPVCNDHSSAVCFHCL